MTALRPDSARCLRRLLLLAGVLLSAPASATLAFERYDLHRQLLMMRLVTATTRGDVLLKQGEGAPVPLQGARLEGLFTLTVPVACARLQGGAALYWVTERDVQQAAIPALPCQAGLPLPSPPPSPPSPSPQPVPRPQHPPLQHPAPQHAPLLTGIDRQGACWLQVGTHTLWRVATMLSERNQATVHQNLYALFLANRDAFVGENINRLRRPVLRCPSAALINSMTPGEAYRRYQEMLVFHQQERARKEPLKE